MRGRLIIVCGLPGSGKTTLARSIESRHAAVRFSPDEWMDTLAIDLYDEGARAKVEGLQWDLAQRLLELGLVVIIEWGTWARSEREALRMRARAMGAAVELRYLDATPDVLIERVRRRGRESPPIADDDMRRWFDVFEAPSEDELALYDTSLDADDEAR